MENQEVTYLVFFITVIFLVLLIFVMTMVLNYYRRNKKYNHHLIEFQYRKEQEILKSQLEIQEQTFINISQEIHDNIGQVLSLVKLNINTMDCNHREAFKDKITDSKHLISKAIQDLRDLSKSLNTDYIADLGLARAIEHEMEQVQKTGGYQIQLDIKGKTYRLEKQQELILFRIVQEVLHNIMKHANASAIDVHLLFDPEIFTLTITDNGVGFDTSKLELNNYTGMGLGIRNMHNRANIINSSFKMTSTLGKGTTTIVTLPLITSKS